jgi:hypothetical protein
VDGARAHFKNIDADRRTPTHDTQDWDDELQKHTPKQRDTAQGLETTEEHPESKSLGVHRLYILRDHLWQPP